MHSNTILEVVNVLAYLVFLDYQEIFVPYLFTYFFIKSIYGYTILLYIILKFSNSLQFLLILLWQGHKQWLAEVQFLGVLEHPNLVKLLGYCAVDSERGPQRLLVYEFMPNKSLEDHLFRRANPPLSWNKRLQVILGAAEGLAYLHEGVEVQVIYRDFKTSNILLDKDFRAKLSDFGLAREGPTGENTHVSTAVRCIHQLESGSGTEDNVQFLLVVVGGQSIYCCWPDT